LAKKTGPYPNGLAHTAACTAIAATFSAFLWVTALRMHQKELGQIVKATYSILYGEPHWRVYQNRLMGPWLVQSFTDFFGMDVFRSYLLVSLLLSLSMGLTFFFLFRRLAGGDKAGLRLSALGCLIFLFFQNNLWLYLWDFADAIAFTFFCYGALRRKGIAFFASVFLLSILFKESALFIPLWMVAASFLEDSGRLGRKLSKPRLDWLLTGAGLFVGGALLVDQLRSKLLVRAFFPEDSGSWEHGAHVHFKLAGNLDALWRGVTSFGFGMQILVVLVVLGFPALLIGCRDRLRGRMLDIAGVYTAIYLSILLFGMVMEFRVFSILIPFVLVFWMDLDREGTASQETPRKERELDAQPGNPPPPPK
jgi:hypothetical protein